MPTPVWRHKRLGRKLLTQNEEIPGFEAQEIFFSLNGWFLSESPLKGDGVSGRMKQKAAGCDHELSPSNQAWSNTIRMVLSKAPAV